MVYIKQVKIQDFKNFSNEQVFDFLPGVNIITGKNGCGKTTILDAICWVLKGRLLSGVQEGWKPKDLVFDQNGNPMSNPKQIFNTVVEVTLAFDDGQKDIVLKRTSNCGRSTVIYYNGITDTQKQINKYLEDALGFDVSKILIFSNPEILFNPDEVSQQDCGRLIYDSVRNSVSEELKELKEHIFDEYVTNLTFLEEDSLEKSIATKSLNTIKTKLDNAKKSENDIIEELEADIADNVLTLESKNEIIKSQELILQQYYLNLNKVQNMKIKEQKLDAEEQKFRDLDFRKQRLLKEKEELETENNKLKVWLHDFNNALALGATDDELKARLGIKPSTPINAPSSKLNVLKIEDQKVRCPVCGNWYIPKQDKEHQEILKRISEFNKKQSEAEKQNNQNQSQQTEKFDYLPYLNKIKENMADYISQISSLDDQIYALDKSINCLLYKTREEIQIERNKISTFNAEIDSGKKVARQVEAMKDTCLECNLTNKYLNVLNLTIQNYQKQKLNIIKNKLNSNLTSGSITLFKMQANGIIKESVTILDRDSNAEYKETNQSKKIKMGIEVCKVLQDFNNINFPIFIDELGRFSDYNFIRNLGHQIVATLPTPEDTLKIIH